MKKLTTLSILFISLVFIAPIQVSAATNAGVKPGSFFYFFDTAFENVGLFFTFNAESKAKKALGYADERLAEAEESASENNPKAVEKAMTGYKEEVSFATEKSKELKDDKKAEELLNIVSENTAKHQEVLKGVLEKVPDEAKEAILKAIEVSKKSQEEAVKQITELKGEIEKLKKEVAELKKESSNPQENEVEKLKKEVESLKKQSVTQSTPKQLAPTTKNSQEQKKIEEKLKTVTLPSGAVVEMDANGDITRYVSEPPFLKISPTTRRINVSRANYTNDTVIRTNSPHRVLSINVLSEGNGPVSFSDVIVCMEGAASYDVIGYIFLEKNPGKHYFLDTSGCSTINDESFFLQPKGIGGSGTSIVIYAALVKEIPIFNNDKLITFVLKSIQTDGEIIGSLPIVGYEYKMPPPPLPKVIATTGRVDSRNNQTYKKSGTKDYIFASIKITSDKEVFLNSIKWNMTGSGGFFSLENLKTHINDVSYDVTPPSDGKYFISNFNGVVINADEAKEIYIKGDIVDTYHTLNFDIYKALDVNITDKNGNVVTPQTELLWDYENSGGFRRGTPWYDGYKVEIEP